MAAEDQSRSCNLPSALDSVALKNLQVEIIAPNVWGTPKEQPALVSVFLTLSHGFESAASKDAVDQNTVNYGTLAKRIRAGCEKNQTLETFSSMVENIVVDMSMREDGTCRVSRSIIQVKLPRASMYGQSMELTTIMSYNDSGESTLPQRMFGLRNMKLMVLIGVKDEERTGKQPLVADLNLSMGAKPKENVSSMNAALFSVERKLAQIIQNTSFETLEALADFTFKQLENKVLSQIPSCSLLQLRFDKPLAVLDAEAASVEVFRKISAGHQNAANTQSATETNKSPSPLKINKPYV